MSQFIHIVYVHPIENGEINLHKIDLERKFDTYEDAKRWVEIYNAWDCDIDTDDKAVYSVCVNNENIELANKRIQELEDQCWEERKYGPPWFDSKKFAKLIVRECIRISDETRTSSLISDRIAEHFGLRS